MQVAKTALRFEFEISLIALKLHEENALKVSKNILKQPVNGSLLHSICIYIYKFFLV